MQIKIFQTHESGAEGELNQFLAQDGNSISVDKILTAGGGSKYSARHWVTVVYYPLAKAPEQL